MMHAYRTIQTFHQLALEGMVLSAPKPATPAAMKPAPAPLVHRCECGKPISNGRHYCRTCLLKSVEQVVTGKADAATVAKVAQQSTSEERVAMIEEMRKRQQPPQHLDTEALP